MKNIISKVIGVLAIFLFMQQEATASHLTGGEIVWECLPTGAYRFTLVLYRDCTGIPVSTSAKSLTNNAGVSISCTHIQVQYINPQCGAPPCNQVPTGQFGALERHVFRSGPIFITGTPPATGWIFSYSECCRPSTANLVGQQNYYLRATMFPYVPPGGGGPLSASPCYDSSPNFLENPAVTVCQGQNAEYLALGFDDDLDSLYYDWEPAKISASPCPTGCNPYQAGYSFTNPMPSTGGSTGAVLNNNLGRITFKSMVNGQFAVATKIQEYRCGQLIGEIVRDLVFTVKQCTPPPGICSAPNNPPTLNFQWYPGFDTLTPVIGANNTVSWYEMTVYARTPVKFKMVSSDFDLQPSCNSQQIQFIGQGGQLSSAANYGNPNTCFFVPPCATMTSLNGNGLFVNGLNNDVEFNWQTTCDHLTFQAFQCGGLRNTYEFFFRFQDNACPLPAFSYATVKINVLNYPPNPPDLSNSCITRLTSGALQFNWIAPLDTGINFDRYVIYRSNAGGPFTAIDSISNYLTTTYTDAAPPAGVNSYFVRTRGGCSLISDPSDTIQNIELNLTAFPPPPNSSIAVLNWNAKSPSGPKGEYYQVWRQICATNNWELIDSTLGLTYTDTVNVCGNCLEYQIRIKNSCNSSLKSGFFSDQSNTDVIAIDSVSVINGLANIAWDTTTTSKDVVSYIILRLDNTGFWVPIATLPRNTPMPYEYTGSTANTGKESFKVVTIDSCGNQSSDLLATAHTSMFLQVNSDPCEGFVRLRWNSYQQWTQTAVGTYELYADVTDLFGATTPNVLIAQLTPNDTVYNHTGLQSGYEYCYYVRVTDTTATRHATSNRKCINALVVNKSRILYLARTTVRLDGSIESYAFIDKDADVIDFGIERADNALGPYFVIGRIPKPTSGPWELKYSDYGVTPESKKYYYRFTSRDSCGAVDTTSNYGRNILVRAKSNGNLTNTVAWNPYEQFGGRVGKYQIFRQLDQNGSWTLAGEVGGNDTVFIDNIRPFGDGKGSFCYHVVAVETDNPLAFVDEYGQPFSSRSNDVCVVQEARIFIPTAFNPNSDVESNRIWKPSNVFARTDSYEMFIMNRWGEKVFSTTNVNEGWDGTYKGEPQPMGVYTFFLKYRSYEGLPIEERGSFSLLR
jgi:gliding motility-associated-like protein